MESNSDAKISSISGAKQYKTERQQRDQGTNRETKRENLTEFADRTSCHGPKMIVMSRNIFRKAFWIIAFLAVITVLIAFLVNQAFVYKEATTFQDIRTTFSVEYCPTKELFAKVNLR